MVASVNPFKSKKKIIEFKFLNIDNTQKTLTFGYRQLYLISQKDGK